MDDEKTIEINGNSMRKVPFINEEFFKYALNSLWGVGWIDLGQYEGDFIKWYETVGKNRFDMFSITEDVLYKDLKSKK